MACVVTRFGPCPPQFWHGDAPDRALIRHEVYSKRTLAWSTFNETMLAFQPTADDRGYEPLRCGGTDRSFEIYCILKTLQHTSRGATNEPLLVNTLPEENAPHMLSVFLALAQIHADCMHTDEPRDLPRFRFRLGPRATENLELIRVMLDACHESVERRITFVTIDRIVRFMYHQRCATTPVQPCRSVKRPFVVLARGTTGSSTSGGHSLWADSSTKGKERMRTTTFDIPSTDLLHGRKPITLSTSQSLDEWMRVQATKVMEPETAPTSGAGFTFGSWQIKPSDASSSSGVPTPHQRVNTEPSATTQGWKRQLTEFLEAAELNGILPKDNLPLQLRFEWIAKAFINIFIVFLHESKQDLFDALKKKLTTPLIQFSQKLEADNQNYTHRQMLETTKDVYHRYQRLFGYDNRTIFPPEWKEFLVRIWEIYDWFHSVRERSEEATTTQRMQEEQFTDPLLETTKRIIRSEAYQRKGWTHNTVWRLLSAHNILVLAGGLLQRQEPDIAFKRAIIQWYRKIIPNTMNGPFVSNLLRNGDLPQVYNDVFFTEVVDKTRHGNDMENGTINHYLFQAYHVDPLKPKSYQATPSSLAPYMYTITPTEVFNSVVHAGTGEMVLGAETVALWKETLKECTVSYITVLERIPKVDYGHYYLCVVINGPTGGITVMVVDSIRRFGAGYDKVKKFVAEVYGRGIEVKSMEKVRQQEGAQCGIHMLLNLAQFLNAPGWIYGGDDQKNLLHNINVSDDVVFKKMIETLLIDVNEKLENDGVVKSNRRVYEFVQ